MNQPKTNISKGAPLDGLSALARKEIDQIEKRLRREMRERMLYSYGEVRNWLIFGWEPNGQLAMALNEATETDWREYLLERQEAGTPVPESTGRTNLAADEMPRRWSGLLTVIKSLLPPGAELKTWPGFVPLAHKMMDEEG